MNYALGYAFNIHDMFASFDTGRLDLDAKTCEGIIGNRHKEVIAKQVFKYAVKLVIDDIINDSIRFEMPTNGRKSYLSMKRVTGDDFVKARRHGKWKDVDFLNSNFTGHQMILTYQNHEMLREKLVYLDTARRDLITQKTNDGKQYY